ncbi:MAG: 2-oxoglutarate dehydrogenase E1 component [Chthoniobacterales bacterium]|nr:2-oxoglutarate dehydrogenase E1 component [Chthoniobacterales bacterium]
MSTAFLAKWNEEAIDENYEQWRRDPLSVGADWASFFEGFELGFARYQKKPGTITSPAAISSSLECRVEGMINTYRTLGHTMADLNPLSSNIPEQPWLSLDQWSFSEAELKTMVSSTSFRRGEKMLLVDLIKNLRSIYCGKSTVELMHIQNREVRDWVRDCVEEKESSASSTPHYRILRTLHKAELFENFLHTTYVGSKRFSIEGGESLLVALSEILRRSPEHGIKEIVLGMAHRGRLNVLANFLKKPFAVIFNEFSDEYRPEIGEASGDVKYHLGYQTTRRDESETPVEIYLAANPSHLEAVNPVVMGKARARQRILGDTETRRSVIPILIHGDAAFIGQGIVAECLNFSQLAGYRVGGTIHIVVNNQIGFTTLPADARSTLYCTDVAKIIEAPIFHVNGDDPIAVAKAVSRALAFRQRFGRDVVVDIVCYRRYGHNEGDEPSFTQPNLYKIIKKHPRVSEVFLKNAFALGTITQEEAQESHARTTKHLEEALAKMKKGLAASGYDKKATFVGSTAVSQSAYCFDPVDTAISKERLKSLVEGLTTIPEEFRLLPKVRKTMVEHRQKLLQSGGPYDWSFGEALAFGSLLVEGTPVRLSGQDSRRGTFSQRHSVFYDEVTRERFIPLLHLAPDQEKFCVYNSPLSEASVLGFDYGYSMDFPKMLCIWEAQFGDFANGAQVIIDQFIASSETKWLRPSSLVMLLPHGYEGMGPEHSSARLERYLQLCAEENMEVCNATTPAQYFHLLRRQMRRTFRKPLIIMTPKSLLRSEAATSRTEDFTTGHFEEILLGPIPTKKEAVERIVFCSGKIYYELLSRQQEQGWSERSLLVRLEQLYPLHKEKLLKLVKPYLTKVTAEIEGVLKTDKIDAVPGARSTVPQCISNTRGDEHRSDAAMGNFRLSQDTLLVWCQEEPQNMGAYTYIAPRLQKLFGKEIFYAGREASASTAVGAAVLHRLEQKSLIEEALP